ncbi:MAG: site-2 protease family protein [Chitinispirillaceae bacterium]|nr:site-2 protease family protein [Chitinispirillaceae bacterium]
MQPDLLVLRIPVILLALTIHEYAHGYVAWRLGDPTAKNAGRLTFNPIAHLDVFGTIMLMFGPFGWAKPVPVNGYNFANPKRDSLWVSLAGPASNIIAAVVFGYTYRMLGALAPEAFANPQVLIFFQLAILINIGIAFFNLIPVPPLDGSHILLSLLPNRLIPSYLNKMRFVPTIFLIMLVAEWMFHIPVFSSIMNPLFTPFKAFWYFVIFWKF